LLADPSVTGDSHALFLDTCILRNLNLLNKATLLLILHVDAEPFHSRRVCAFEVAVLEASSHIGESILEEFDRSISHFDKTLNVSLWKRFLVVLG